MIVHKLDENLRCYCKHTWDEHHHGCVMNPEYFEYPLTIMGCIAQECEHNQTNGEWYLNKGEKKYCRCNSFRPSSTYVQKLVKEWREKHPPRS
jgi:hypothetical protein